MGRCRGMAKRILMLVGRSTHSLEQAANGVRENADYIGFGPVFSTPTKPEYEPIGTQHIRDVHASHP
ncbi:MAG TPA: thiamine phosphate synthase, partial [Armatimonadetes bacterium]|nr:thiamine phosphate synthase [Armatimonadota bacterium]